MKALTLWQPWASLFVLGEKRFETRSWQTDHQGWLAVHAASTSEHLHVVLSSAPMQAALNDHGFDVDTIPLGAVLGIVWIEGCYPVADWRRKVSLTERAFGDWSPGRFVWQATGFVAFADPIPARGAQRLWDWQPTERWWDRRRLMSVAAPTGAQIAAWSVRHG